MCCQLTGRKSGPLKQRVARRARSGDVTGGARRSVMRTAVADIGSDAIQSGGRPVFVGVLAAFRLHFNRDTGGNVRGTDSGFCLIHMLAARPCDFRRSKTISLSDTACGAVKRRMPINQFYAGVSGGAGWHTATVMFRTSDPPEQPHALRPVTAGRNAGRAVTAFPPQRSL